MVPIINLNTNVTPCQRQHLIDWFKGHQNMIVHGKVGKLDKFDRLTPNYVATRPKTGLNSYIQNPLTAIKHKYHRMSTPTPA